MIKLFIIGMGGFVGAVLRYEISGLAHRIWGAQFPWGTLTVNVLGSLVLGFFLTLAEGRFLITPQWRTFIAIGLLGAFTTFSTFSFETMALVQNKLYIKALFNSAGSLLAGLIAVWLGMQLAKIL